jgi:hypothetical protein
VRIKFTGFVDIPGHDAVACAECILREMDEGLRTYNPIQSLSLTWEETQVTKEQAEHG